MHHMDGIPDDEMSIADGDVDTVLGQHEVPVLLATEALCSSLAAFIMLLEEFHPGIAKRMITAVVVGLGAVVVGDEEVGGV